MGAQKSVDCPQARENNIPIQDQAGQIYPPQRDLQHFVRANIKQYASQTNVLEFNLSKCVLQGQMIGEVLMSVGKIVTEKEKQKNEKDIELKIIFVDSKIDSLSCKYITTISLTNLRQLNLSNNLVRDEGCSFLFRANWPNLNAIDLSLNQIGQKGCKYLSQGQWPNLNALIIPENRIGEKGVKHLSKGKWPQLNWLVIVANEIYDRGCRNVTKGQWPLLKLIGLNNNRITDKGSEHLSKGNFIDLDWIQLDNNAITEQTLIPLRKKYPKCFRLQFERQYEDHIW